MDEELLIEIMCSRIIDEFWVIKMVYEKSEKKSYFDVMF